MYPQVLKMQMCTSVSVDGSRRGPLLDQSETTEPVQVSQCWVRNYWSGLPNPGIWSTAPSSWRCYCPQQNTNSFTSVSEITVTFEDSVQLLSCVRLCNPTDCSTSGFPVHHQLLELAQTHVHRVDDAIQLSHPLLSPLPPAFNVVLSHEY